MTPSSREEASKRSPISGNGYEAADRFLQQFDWASYVTDFRS
jgi:hypothetical protein